MPTTTTHPDQIREQIEVNVVELLKTHLEAGTITEDRSRQISQIVLELLKPGMSLEDLYKAIFKLDDSCPELSSVVLPYAEEYEKDVTKKAVNVVSDYIKTGKYDAAAKFAEKVVKNDVDLEWHASAKPTPSP